MTVYDDTVKLWNQERSSNELQPVKPGYFKDLAGYIRRLKEAHRNLDQKSLKAVVIQDELSRLEELISQLVSLRMEKVWKAARAKSPVQVDGSEKQAYESFSEVSRYYDRMREDLIQGREPQAFHAGEKKERITIRFLKEVPSIVGVDLRTYGPFMREDVAIVPYENAEALIRQGAALEVHASAG